LRTVLQAIILIVFPSSMKHGRLAMMRESGRLVLFAAFLALVGTACGSPNRGPLKINEAVLQKEIIRDANRKDVSALKRLRNQAAASSEITKNIFFAALYYADPKQFQPDFVRTFPTDSSVAGYWQVLPNASTGFEHTFPYGAFGAAASNGDPLAMRKLMIALRHSDGIVAELIADEVGRTAGARPAMFLRQLALLPPGAGSELAREFGSYSCGSATIVSKVAAKSKWERSLQSEMAHTASAARRQREC
jgi:hypothetical protein